MPLLSHNELNLTERQIPLKRLPVNFDGLRIAQISDLHFYEYSPADYFHRVQDAVNRLQADVVVMTGDVVHYGEHHIAQAGEFLQGIEARLVKLAILGNHDYQDGALGHNIAAMLDQASFQLLVNKNTSLTRGTDTLWFAGIDDLYYGKPDVAKALQDIPEEAATIVLAHNPLLFDPIALAGQKPVDLVITGHTHAGHIYIPFLGPIYRKIFRMKYRYGLYEKNGCRMHVTSGIGSAAFYLKKQRIGFPRCRFNTCPEVALLTFTKNQPDD